MRQPIFGITANGEKAAKRAMELGVDFVDLHFRGRTESLSAALDALEKQNTSYMLNIEGAEMGWLPPERLRVDLKAREGFLGFMLDEADHMQINSHWEMIAYYGYGGQHFFADTEGMDLLSAWRKVSNVMLERRDAFTLDNKKPAIEFLHPVMMHTAAANGYSVSPKILKETYGPAMLAVAMGAARQYDTDFYIDVDYWWHNEAIGHTPQRFLSALQLAYWSGADRIYVEGGAARSNGHPWGREIERVYKDFLEAYVPTNPRPFDWRSFKPQTAIVRFDDTCFDIRQKYHGEFPGPLYGHCPAGPENTEWFNIWNLLSHGFFRTDCLSHQWESRRIGSRTLFAPLHNVVVYDHEAGYKELAGNKLIFLTGVMISDGAWQAAVRCVEEGAVCVLPPRLAAADSGMKDLKEVTITAQGAGKWVVVPDLYSIHYECFAEGPVNKVLRDVLSPLTGNGSHLVYDFGDTVVKMTQQGWDYPKQEFGGSVVPVTQAGSDPDVLEVEIIQ